MNLFEFPDGTVSASIQNQAAAPNLQIKFGPSVNFAWQFPSWLYVAQEIDAAPLPAISSFELVLKVLGDFDGNAVASNYNSGTNTWVYSKTGTGAAATYTAQIPFNTSALFEALMGAAGGVVVDRPADQAARYLLTGLTLGQVVQEVGTMTYWVVINPASLATSAGWSSDVTVATQIVLGAELAVFFADGSALKTLPFSITVLASYTEVPGTIVLSTLGGYPAPGTLIALGSNQTFTGVNNFTGGLQIGGVAVPAPATIPALAGANTYTAANNFAAGLLQIGGVAVPSPAAIALLAGAQTFTAANNFTGGLKIGGVTLAAVSVDTGWTANSDAGDKTKVIPATATLATFQTNLNATLTGMGDAFFAMAQKIKALEAAAAAASPLLPNA